MGMDKGEQTVAQPYKGILLGKKRNNTTDSTAWINLNHVMLSEGGLHKACATWFHLYETLEHDKLIYNEKKSE